MLIYFVSHLLFLFIVYILTVHAKDQKLLQDMRSCNGAIIAGPDQSLLAQIEFSSKFT